MEELGRQIRDSLTRKKVSFYEIFLRRTSSAGIEVKNRKPDFVEKGERLGYGIRILSKNRMGFSYGTDFSPSAVDFVVGSALESSRHVFSDPRCVLAKPALFPAAGNCDPSFVEKTAAQKTDLVSAMEKFAFDRDKRIKRVRYASYNETFEETWLLNSTGLFAGHKRSRYTLGLMAVAESGPESEMSADEVSSPCWNDLNPAVLGASVADEAVCRLGGVRVSGKKGMVILNPRVAVGMLSVLAPSALGENVRKKNSFLAGKKEKKIYSSVLSIVDDGLCEKGERTAPFDDEGVPHQKTVVIDKGRVSKFLYDLYWAEKDGMASTGNAVRHTSTSRPQSDVTNFYIEPGAFSPDELLKKMDSGFLVTEVIGMHTADEISGDFSVGIQGFVVAGGRKGQPVRSMVASGNLHELFSGVVSVGSDLKFYGEVGAPSVLVDGLSVAG